MRIIDKNKTEEIIRTCDDCGCKFAYTEDDVYTNMYGKVVECPSCREEIIIEKFNRSLQFPESYFHFGGKDSKIIDNRTIEQEVKQCIKYCLEHNEKQYCVAYGNMFIEVNRLMDEQSDDGFEIIVAQNYYSTTINTKDAKDLINYYY